MSMTLYNKTIDMNNFFLSACMLLLCSCGTSNAENALPDDEGGDIGTIKKKQHILYADPTIILENGTYYMSGTSQVGNQSSRGFTVLQSDDLKEWTTGTKDTYRFMIGPEWGTTFGTKGFWAPQWFKADNGKYRFFYTANEQVAVAQSDNIAGIFKQNEAKAIDPSVGNIDPFIFKDDDGKFYLYHVRFGGGNFIWVAEYDFDSDSIDKSTLTQCLDITEPWELMKNYDNSKIMEGPTVVKWDGIYYLFYSANHFCDPDYAVGYATATSPKGPWTKYKDNPIIRRDIVGEKGAGHGDIFKGKDNKYYYVYHVWGDNDNPHARQTRIVPLKREKGSDGIYRISVEKANIIIPLHVY